MIYVNTRTYMYFNKSKLKEYFFFNYPQHSLTVSKFSLKGLTESTLGLLIMKWEVLKYSPRRIWRKNICNNSKKKNKIQMVP